MNPRSFHFRLDGMRGIPGVLALLLMVGLIVGVVALVLLVGMAVAGTGLVLSVCAGLYYAVRRKLAGRSPRAEQALETPSLDATGEVQEIEFEIVPEKELR